MRTLRILVSVVAVVGLLAVSCSDDDVETDRALDALAGSVRWADEWSAFLAGDYWRADEDGRLERWSASSTPPQWLSDIPYKVVDSDSWGTSSGQTGWVHKLTPSGPTDPEGDPEPQVRVVWSYETDAENTDPFLIDSGQAPPDGEYLWATNVLFLSGDDPEHDGFDFWEADFFVNCTTDDGDHAVAVGLVDGDSRRIAAYWSGGRMYRPESDDEVTCP